MLTELFREDIERLLSEKSIYLGLILYILIAGVNLVFIRSELPLDNPNYPPFSAFEYFTSVQGGGSGLLLILFPLSVTLTIGDFSYERGYLV